ncbi:hypothetical protein GCM10010399_86490 [Dactylosporangium fulvum]|uniref:Uncharacterized protein n=1 Tax=Dactylosporangium fulvum TaxID=53359 RepID=A0ABY5VWL9_9ACTN|nr:hypothetical protein [Dactylosporangium fulvum]UWP82147.1 hypothetical protein Dfulv_44975 [Dactylosporangium fulvum]
MNLSAPPGPDKIGCPPTRVAYSPPAVRTQYGFPSSNDQTGPYDWGTTRP